MDTFYYSKSQDLANSLLSYYEYIVVDGEKIRITSRKEIGPDSVLIHTASANSCPVLIGYKKTKE